MKIRKANIRFENRMIDQVFIHENKKEEYILIAVPNLEWSTIILYEEDISICKERLLHSLKQRMDEETAEHLTTKMNEWIREM